MDQWNRAGFTCLTDWTVFEAAATDLDELPEPVTSYISLGEDICIPTRTYLTFNNDKPWFTAKLRHLCQAKEDAQKWGRDLYNQARNTLNEEIREAKRSYARNLEDQFTSNDSASVWKGLKTITNYRTPPPALRRINNMLKTWMSFIVDLKPYTPVLIISSHLLAPPATPLSPSPALQVSEDDVSSERRKDTSLSKNLCWPAGPHLLTDLQ